MHSYYAFMVISILMVAAVGYAMRNLGKNLSTLQTGKTLDKLAVLEVGVNISLYGKTFDKLIKRKKLEIYVWLVVLWIAVFALIGLTVGKSIGLFNGV